MILCMKFSDLERSDNGNYVCIASSENGRAIWSANLRLELPTNPNIGFFRSPEPSTYPGPPTRPVVVNRTRNSITIAWSRNNKIGSSSLLGYQVGDGERYRIEQQNNCPDTSRPIYNFPMFCRSKSSLKT